MRRFVLFLPWLSFTLALPGFALSNPQLVEGLVNIKFQLDSRVFAATAALNAAGFDLDAAELAENPPRKLVRDGCRVCLRNCWNASGNSTSRTMWSGIPSSNRANTFRCLCL